ncbi:hypothetical protein ACWEKR_28465 [Nocardia sp. NPDC004573]
MATLLMEVAGLYGGARLWSGAYPASAAARQRAYDVAGLVGGAIILAVGTEAGDAGQAEQIRQAIAAKVSGAAVRPRRSRDPAGLPAGDIDSDLRLVLELARRWPASGVSTKISGHPAGEPNARRSGDGWCLFRQARRIRP